MTSTIEEVDTDVFKMLSFEHVPNCGIHDVEPTLECDLPAEFRVILSCCKEGWLLCEDHMLLAVNTVRQFHMPIHDEALGGCGQFGTIERVERL